MSRSDLGFFVVALSFAIVVFGLLGYAVGHREAQQEAIKAGVARWAIDPETGYRTFEFLKPVIKVEL